MPITKKDVLAVLDDARLKSMYFFVGPITVSVDKYRNLSEYIKEDDIKVITGKDSVAVYDRVANSIETQAGSPPLNFADRAQLLHECTHAVVDIDKLDVTVLNEEVAAYLAQLTYMALSHGQTAHVPFLPDRSKRNITSHALYLVQKYNLDNLRGFGARILHYDIDEFALTIRTSPHYKDITTTLKGRNDGVEIKHNEMRRLRAALNASLRHDAYEQLEPLPPLDKNRF